jgi:hypothetical protein
MSKMLVFLILFLIINPNLSCNHGSANQNISTAANTSAEKTSPSPHANIEKNANQSVSTKENTSTQQNQIHSVDFKNFIYPWYPEGCAPDYKKRKITLKDGEFVVYADYPKKIENVWITLDDVSYIDVTHDGQEEAIVTLGGVVTTNSGAGCVFVYTIKNGKPLLLWKHETGDRANGGLRKLFIQDENLIVEQYSDKEGGGLCCPKIYIRTKYKWDGNRFVEIQSETLKNEYNNAEFLGYPNDFKDKQ